jgi:cytochrome c oxidase assembly factor CtaG
VELDVSADANSRYGARAVIPRREESTRLLWFLSRVGFAALAVWVAVTEPWDVNGNGRLSPHEVLLFVVRFLAFPLHLLLSITPSSVLHALGLPDAYWPSSAVVAVVLSLPLWGLVLIGGLFAEAWLERLFESRQKRKDA